VEGNGEEYEISTVVGRGTKKGNEEGKEDARRTHPQNMENPRICRTAEGGKERRGRRRGEGGEGKREGDNVSHQLTKRSRRRTERKKGRKREREKEEGEEEDEEARPQAAYRTR
jgi:hypothetical protein